MRSVRANDSLDLNCPADDIVQLKPGDPFMTVEDFDAESVSCVWLEGRTEHRGMFYLRVLKKGKSNLSVCSSRGREQLWRQAGELSSRVLPAREDISTLCGGRNEASGQFRTLNRPTWCKERGSR